MVRGRRVLACALACAALARAQTSAAGSSSCLDATYGLAQCVGLDPGELSVYEIYALASAFVTPPTGGGAAGAEAGAGAARGPVAALECACAGASAPAFALAQAAPGAQAVGACASLAASVVAFDAACRAQGLTPNATAALGAGSPCDGNLDGLPGAPGGGGGGAPRNASALAVLSTLGEHYDELSAGCQDYLGGSGADDVSRCATEVRGERAARARAERAAARPRAGA